MSQAEDRTHAAGAPVEQPGRPLYAERDHQAQGSYYTRHIDAMTREGLHAKSAIAGELAHRDIVIDALRARLDAVMLEHCPEEMSDAQLAEWADAQKPIPPDMARVLAENLWQLMDK